MQELAFIAISSLLALLIVAMAALRGWDGWLALKRAELAHPTDSVPIVGGRIEMADLKERIRKLEAIAAGVDP